MIASPGVFFMLVRLKEELEAAEARPILVDVKDGTTWPVEVDRHADDILPDQTIPVLLALYADLEIAVLGQLPYREQNVLLIATRRKQRDYQLVHRGIAAGTNRRTTIAALLPRLDVASSNKAQGIDLGGAHRTRLKHLIKTQRIEMRVQGERFALLDMSTRTADEAVRQQERDQRAGQETLL